MSDESNTETVEATEATESVEVMGQAADPRESAEALGGVQETGLLPGAERPLTTMEIVERRQRIEAARVAIGWSWLGLSEQVNLATHQGIAIKNGRRTLSEAHVEWLEFLASVHEANPVPDRIGPATGREWRVGSILQPAAPPAPPPAPERTVPRPLYQMALAPEERPTIERERVIAAICNMYRAAQDGTLDVTSAEAATVMGTVSQMAKRLGVLDDVRDALAKARAVVG